ncbi:HNH endonuclease signature motif containing protein [Streptomyces sp. NPDC020983]|uniref:HNH endonuclease signature motif containing protein n=1 Tax=Streptomyces sp. NPDC020983 TaxID=3365106 RepID=UPI00378BDE54
MCGRCYRRTRKQAIKAGTFEKLDRSVPLRDRLLDKTAAGPNGCIIWTAHTNNRGYGTIGSGGKDGRTVYAHRVSYELFVGAITAGMMVDHQCHNDDPTCGDGDGCLHRRCINPYHLQLVTAGENQRKSTQTFASANLAKTHCRNGHPFDEANTYVRPDTGGRQCRQCRLDRARRKCESSAAALLATPTPGVAKQDPMVDYAARFAALDSDVLFDLEASGDCDDAQRYVQSLLMVLAEWRPRVVAMLADAPEWAVPEAAAYRRALDRTREAWIQYEFRYEGGPALPYPFDLPEPAPKGFAQTETPIARIVSAGRRDLIVRGAAA